MKREEVYFSFKLVDLFQSYVTTFLPHDLLSVCHTYHPFILILNVPKKITFSSAAITSAKVLKKKQEIGNHHNQNQNLRLQRDWSRTQSALKNLRKVISRKYHNLHHFYSTCSFGKKTFPKKVTLQEECTSNGWLTILFWIFFWRPLIAFFNNYFHSLKFAWW